ncbi:neuronal acetylcholine receptor subunit alpha-3-like isoform X1 [Stegostoma tigrinum]|uniref:neuronal acetylcholine receptor subunit alpha-3-like isoform X1 n=1 Tax=Stegostoma tigrinum TaxID=3053191 RepID=UPI00202AF0EA|nr:neuronal acetylcholine receptor subunit alpha-3-like isoform X1 [Stegostoma tigrinum]
MRLKASIEPLAGCVFFLFLGAALSTEGERKLFAKLFANYSRYIRPVENVSRPAVVQFEVSLSQLIKVDEINQIMETNLWLKHIWSDYKLKWDPAEYGGVKSIRIPSEKIWKPDIVLYNNAVADFQVDEKTKVLVKFDGTVTWIPPAIFKSSCRMDVTYFPFDYQNCSMKFGSWTHDQAKIDLALIGNEINRKDFWESGEWEIIAAPGFKHAIKYNCCEEIYPDITYSIYIRRMPLFYTINIIIPCLMISFLTILVFYLPSDCGEKVTLSISVLLSLTVFLLVITESIPSTSLVIPLIGEYLLFTMIFVILSIVITVFVLNIHYRTPMTHTMPVWVKTIFLKLLPRVMFMKRPTASSEVQKNPRFFNSNTELTSINSFSRGSKSKCPGDGFCYQDPQCTHCRFCKMKNQDVGINSTQSSSTESLDALLAISSLSPEVQEAIGSITYIAENMKLQNESKEIQDDWKYVAMVIDRIFLWIFILIGILGTATSFLQPLMNVKEL